MTDTDTSANLGASNGRSSEQIRSEIDRTRSSMDETFAALDSKLTPSQIGLEIWNLFKGGSSAGASKLWRVAREHPMPAAVIGLGLGWLMVESSRKDDEYDGLDRTNLYGEYGYGRTSAAGRYSTRYSAAGYSATGYSAEGGYADYDADDESSGRLSAAKDKVKDLAGSAKDAVAEAGHKVGDTVGEAAGWTKEHALDLGHQAKYRASALKGQAKVQTRRAKMGFWQTMEQSPLMVGAATLALGVIAGLAIPSTHKEDELMGETRDRLLDEVKETGKDVLEKGKHVAEAVADKVKDEVHNAGLTPEGVADKVKQVAREATNTAKEEAKRQNLTPESLAQSGQQAAQNVGDTAKAAVHEHEPELVKR